MPTLMLVCGARPNFMKVAPILAEMRRRGRLTPFLVHTGQHYDEKMSKSFFDTLGIQEPDIDLGVGSGSHAEQTAKVMVEFEKLCLKVKPDMVLVVGDVNSTMACTIVAKKLWIDVCHVEAGLRSFDMKMPEEINRMVTDAICDVFFTTDPEGNRNLRQSGIAEDRIVFAGNVMIDTLLQNLEKAKTNPILGHLGLERGHFALMTMHRPSNVDDPEVLKRILVAIDHIQKSLPVVFPAHPRTIKMIEQFGYKDRFESMKKLKVTGPLDYHQTLCLNSNSKCVITDSGGLQEETTALGIPCMTIRENTERPVTVTVGSNEVVGTDPSKIIEAFERIMAGKWKKGGIPEGWDGKASERIVAHLEKRLN